MPNSSAPSLRSVSNASNICSRVMPYFASPGLSIIRFPISNAPPGLYLQHIFLGIPAIFFKISIWVMSSRLMIAPRRAASAYSSSGVSFEENMILSPENPHFSDIINSVSDEQSTPHPTEPSMLRIAGVGVAFTAKNSLYPLFQENAS